MDREIIDRHKQLSDDKSISAGSDCPSHQLQHEVTELKVALAREYFPDSRKWMSLGALHYCAYSPVASYLDLSCVRSEELDIGICTFHEWKNKAPCLWSFLHIE